MTSSSSCPKPRGSVLYPRQLFNFTKQKDSGVGACVAANKVAGVRASLIHETFSARHGVEDDDLNVICLGSLVVG